MGPTQKTAARRLGFCYDQTVEGWFIIFKTLQQAMLLHSNCMAWMIKQETDFCKTLQDFVPSFTTPQILAYICIPSCIDLMTACQLTYGPFM